MSHLRLLGWLLVFLLATPLVEAEEPQTKWSGALKLGYGYDDNVAIDDVDLRPVKVTDFWMPVPAGV